LIVSWKVKVLVNWEGKNVGS